MNHSKYNLGGKIAISNVDDVVKDLKDSWSETKPVERKNCPKCGQPMDYWTPIGESAIWRCERCNITISQSALRMHTTPLWKKTLKYFVHGVAFSALFVVLEVLWIFATSLLTIIGGLLGLIIGVLFLFLVVGAINSTLTRLFWGFSMQDTDVPTWGRVVSIFLQGLVLFVTLLMVDLVFLFPRLIYRENITVIIASFIVTTFIYGIIGEKIGEKMR